MMIRGRIVRGVLHHVEHGTVSYGALCDRLHVLRPALSRAIYTPAHRGEITLLDRHRQPIDPHRRACHQVREGSMSCAMPGGQKVRQMAVLDRRANRADS